MRTQIRRTAASPRLARLAAAALLFEIGRADAEVKEEERTVMRAAIQGTFGLDREETEELMRLAEQESRDKSIRKRGVAKP